MHISYTIDYCCAENGTPPEKYLASDGLYWCLFIDIKNRRVMTNCASPEGL